MVCFILCLDSDPKCCLDINYKSEQPSFIQWVQILSVTSISAGILFGTISYTLENKLFRKLPFGLLSVIGTLSYLISVVIVFLLTARTFMNVLEYTFFKRIDEGGVIFHEWVAVHHLLFRRGLFCRYV